MPPQPMTPNRNLSMMAPSSQLLAPGSWLLAGNRFEPGARSQELLPVDDDPQTVRRAGVQQIETLKRVVCLEALRDERRDLQAAVADGGGRFPPIVVASAAGRLDRQLPDLDLVEVERLLHLVEVLRLEKQRPLGPDAL